MSDLKLIDCITLATNDGNKLIELYLGDITKLPIEDKVDIIMVSSFPGDYSAVRGTLIGSLKYNCEINVKELSCNKAEDMRRNFNCWISQDLPSNASYHRLLCFEQPFHNYLPAVKAVGEIFRALFTVVSKKESTVITPLLATGNQNINKRRMLESMVSACASWMRAGLPLKVLKLVIFSKTCDVNKLSADDQKAIQRFQELKKYLCSLKQTETTEITHDLYFSFDIGDAGFVDDILKQLCSIRKNLRVIRNGIVTNKQTEDTSSGANDTECDAVENLDPLEKRRIQLSSCFCVCTVLSPRFLANSSCVEEYNLAMCLARTLGRALLTPCFIEVVEGLPIYMTMVQWIDFKVKNTLSNVERLQLGSKKLLDTLQLASHTLENKDLADASSKKASSASHSTKTYDVFLSYAHRDREAAQHVVSKLRSAAGVEDVFYDVDELKAGYSWRQTLHDSLDNSRCVVALLSPSYCESAMCREEFVIAQLLAEAQSWHGTLFPVLIAPLNVDKTPSFIAVTQSRWLSACKELDVAASKLAQRISDSLVHDIDSSTARMDFIRASEDFRVRFFRRHWHISAVGYPEFLDSTAPANTTSSVLGAVALEGEKDEENLQEIDIGFSYHSTDVLAAHFLRALLRRRRPDLRTHWFCVEEKTRDIGNQARQLANLERPKLIVPLLSVAYMSDMQCTSHLYVALSRKSIAQVPMCPVALSTIGQYPSMMHLLPVRIHLKDALWSDLTKTWRFGYDSRTGRLYDEFDSLLNCVDKAATMSNVEATLPEIENLIKKQQALGSPLPPDSLYVALSDSSYGFKKRVSALPVSQMLALSCAVDLILHQVNRPPMDDSALWDMYHVTCGVPKEDKPSANFDADSIQSSSKNAQSNSDTMDQANPSLMKPQLSSVTNSEAAVNESSLKNSRSNNDSTNGTHATQLCGVL